MQMRVSFKNKIVNAGRMGDAKLLIILLFLLVLYSCVDEFMPDIKQSEPFLVIEGSIVKGETRQTVKVSRSTTLNNSEFNPVNNCIVQILDDKGQVYNYSEVKDGVYQLSTTSDEITFGAKYQLRVLTPDDNEYVSEFEEVLASSPIDSVYYIQENKQIGQGEVSTGLQLYTDLKAPERATKNYRWVVEETWEVLTSYGIDGFWDQDAVTIPVFDPVSDSINQCWTTATVKENYIATTANLVVNEKRKIGLNYTPAESTKLNIGYSALVKQYALSDDAYDFWEQSNSGSDNGGLYTKQPAQSKRNIYNVNDPEEIVLGFFWATSYSTKRVFFEGPLTIPYTNCGPLIKCIPSEGQTLFRFFKGIGKDVFLVALEFSSTKVDSVSLWGYPENQICIDCTAGGGRTQKPDFWPK